MDKSDFKLDIAAGYTKSTEGSNSTTEISLNNKKNLEVFDDTIIYNDEDWIDYGYDHFNMSTDEQRPAFTPEFPPIPPTKKKPPKNSKPCSEIQTSESPKCKKRKLPSFDELLESLDYNILYFNFTKLLQFLESNSIDMCFPFTLQEYEDFFKMLLRNISLLKSKSLDAHYRDICDKIAEAANFKKTGFLLTYIYECRQGYQNIVLVIKKVYVTQKSEEESSSSSSLTVMPSSQTSSDMDTNNTMSRSPSPGTISSGFKIHCLRTALAFVKNEVTKTKEFPELSTEQAHFMQLLLDSVVAFADLGSSLETKELFTALWEAVRIHSLKYEFRVKCVDTFGDKKNLVFEKIPKTKPVEMAINLDQPVLNSEQIMDSNAGARKPEATKPEAPKPEASKPEAPKPEASKPEPQKALLSTPQISKPKTTEPVFLKPEIPKQVNQMPKNVRKKLKKLNNELFFIKHMPSQLISDTLHSIIAFLSDPLSTNLVFVPKTQREQDFYRRCIDWCRCYEVNKHGAEFKGLQLQILSLLEHTKFKIAKSKHCNVNENTGIKEVTYVKPSRVHCPPHVPNNAGSTAKKKKVNLQNVLKMAATTDNIKLSSVVNLNQSTGISAWQIKSWADDSSSETSSERGSSWDRSKALARPEQLTKKFTEDIVVDLPTREIAEADRWQPRHISVKEILREGLSIPVQSDKAMRMMRGMGWSGGALGARGNGITEPLMPALDVPRGAGLGHISNLLYKIRKSNTLPKKLRRPNKGPSFIAEKSVTPSVSESDVIVQKTNQLLLNNPTFDSLMKMIELTESSNSDIKFPKSITSNVELPKSTTSNVERPETTLSNVERPETTISNVERPESTISNNVELPKSTTSNYEHPKLTTSNAELKLATSNIEVPKSTSNVECQEPSTSNYEHPKLTTSDAEVPTSTSNVERQEPTTSNYELPNSTTSIVERPEPTTLNTELPKSATSNIELSKSTSNVERPEQTTLNTERPELTTSNTERPEPTTSNTEHPEPTTSNTERPEPTTSNTEHPEPTTSNTERPLSNFKPPTYDDLPQRAIQKLQKLSRFLTYAAVQPFRLKILKSVLELLNSKETSKTLFYDNSIRKREKMFVTYAMIALRGKFNNRGIFLPEELDVCNQIYEIYKKDPHIIVRAFFVDYSKQLDLKKETLTAPVRQKVSMVITKLSPKRKVITARNLDAYIASFGASYVSVRAFILIKFRILFLLNLLSFAKSSDEEIDMSFNKCLSQRQRLFIEKAAEEINMRIKSGASPVEHELTYKINIHMKSAFLGVMFNHQYTAVTLNKFYDFKKSDSTKRKWQTSINIENYSSETHLIDDTDVMTDLTESESDSDESVETDDESIGGSEEHYLPKLPPGEEGVNLSHLLCLYETKHTADITNTQNMDSVSKNDLHTTDNKNNKNDIGNDNILFDDNDNQMIDIKKESNTKDTEVKMPGIEKIGHTETVEYITCVDYAEEVIENELHVKDKENNDLNVKNTGIVVQNDHVESVIQAKGNNAKGESMEVSNRGDLTEATNKDESMEVTNISESMEVTNKGESMEVTNKSESMEVTNRGESMEVTNKSESMEVTNISESMEVKNKGPSSKDVIIAQMEEENSINPSDNQTKQDNLEVKTDCDIVSKRQLDVSQDICDTQSEGTAIVHSTVKNIGPEIKCVSITHVNHPARYLTTTKLKEIQKKISKNIQLIQNKELPYLMCHGTQNGRLTYTCYSRKSYDWLKSIMSTIKKIKFLDSTITKMALTFYCFMNFDSKYLFQMIELYNRNLSTKDWVVEKKEVNDDHVVFIIRMDTFSIDFIQASGLALFVGIDKIEFSPIWE